MFTILNAPEASLIVKREANLIAQAISEELARVPIDATLGDLREVKTLNVRLGRVRIHIRATSRALGRREYELNSSTTT